MNATFSPLDPRKCLEIIISHSCFNQAEKNLSEAKTTVLGTNLPRSNLPSSGSTNLGAKVEGAKEDLKQGAR